MQDIKPHLDKLSKQHKNDPKKLQQEQMKLYQEAGVNPMAGCLFAIVQIPIFIGLYNTLRIFLTHGTTGKVISEINSVLYSPVLHIQSIDPNFFFFNLALAPSKANIWYYYLIPVVTAILQYIQTQQTMAHTIPAPTKADEKEDKKDGKKEEPGTAEEFQKAMNMQMKYVIPLMIGMASYNFPAGLSLYWNIFSLFSIIKHSHVHKNMKSMVKELKT
jgi:YidC/Oxa1 family membrane protein insertase